MHTVNNPKDLTKLLNKSPVVVLKVYADWCGPCKMYGPKFNNLEKKYDNKNISFGESNVDKKIVKVEALPTTIFIKDGRIVDKVVGGDILKVEEKIRRYS